MGELISAELELKRWGDSTIDSLSKNIKDKYPELRGCSPRGLYRMVQFYRTYRHNIIVSLLVSQISWANNLVILTHKFSIEEKVMNFRQTITND